MTLTLEATETFEKVSTAVTVEIDGQLVALDINAGVCFGLNAVATQIWKLLDAHNTVAHLRDALLDLYDIDTKTCEEQTHALLRELVDAGLIARS